MGSSETVRRNIEAIVRLAGLPDLSANDVLARVETITAPGMRALLDDPNLAPEVIEHFALALRLGYEHGNRGTTTWTGAAPTGSADN